MTLIDHEREHLELQCREWGAAAENAQKNLLRMVNSKSEVLFWRYTQATHESAKARMDLIEKRLDLIERERANERSERR